MSDQSNTIVVLGMHRSGTSCCVQMLNAAGAWCGDTRTGKSRRQNGRGVWEDPLIRDFNNALLQANQSNWQVTNPNFQPEASLEISSELLAPYQRSEFTVLKDPRMVVLWGFWRRFFEHALLLPVFRHPVAVAHSLHSRNQMSLQMGLDVWFAYNLPLRDICTQKNLRPIEFGTMAFTDDMKDWIATQTTLNAAAASSAFSSTHIRSRKDHVADLPEHIAELYQQLQMLSRHDD